MGSDQASMCPTALWHCPVARCQFDTLIPEGLSAERLMTRVTVRLPFASLLSKQHHRGEPVLCVYCSQGVTSPSYQ